MEGGQDPPVQKRVPIFIPSHAEVLQQSRPQAPPSLFRSSSSSASPSLVHTTPLPSARAESTSDHFQSDGHLAPTSSHIVTESNTLHQPETFTQAFSFVKKTEFYSPPPAAPVLPPMPCDTLASASAFTSGLKADAAAAGAGAAGQARNAILVSRRQQGNPVLKHIKNARWIYADVVPDYILGQSSCALYLSLRYHLLHPDYLYFRIRELLKSFRLRIVLCFVDVEDVVKPLHEVTKTALLHDCSLLCAWSLEECARYLETIKIYENKPADTIQERTDHDYLSRLTSALTTVRHVNKTDVLTLGSTFGTLTSIMGASMEELARCPGIGERKVKRLYDAFHEPFRRTSKQSRISDVKVTRSSQAANQSPSELPSVVGDAQQDGAAEQSGKVTKSGKTSVRKALEAAYAKYETRRSASDSLEKLKGPADVDETCTENS